MEIKYPFIIFIVAALVLVIVFWRRKRKMLKSNKDSRMVANTSLVKSTKEYKKLERKYKIFLYFMIGTLSLSIIFLSILSARLITVKDVSDKKYNRDIILCMDVSGSMDELNYEIVDTYKKIVGGMNGERFGISIFNTSSYLLVPLTDDYEYVEEVLYNLQRAYDTIGTQVGAGDYENYLWSYSYLASGTLIGEGSSKTGEGLASCVYDFADLDTQRSRVIVLSTDNEVLGDQLVDIVGAAQIANKKGIRVYVIAPSSSSSSSSSNELEELRRVTEVANGKLYVQGDAGTTEGVVSEIEKTEKTLLEGVEKTIVIDYPEVLFVCVFLFFGIFMVVTRFLG